MLSGRGRGPPSIYTDIGRDGALSGTNLDIYARLSGIAGLQVIASGGVSFETEIAALRDMGLYGCILGKALYAGKLRLERAPGHCQRGGAAMLTRRIIPCLDVRNGPGGPRA